MASRNELVTYMNRLLKVADIKDASCNGLQVEGAANVKKVGLAVDACMAVFEMAVAKKCDMVIAHHGLLWGRDMPIVGIAKKRIALLLDENINLYAAHLPLDMHAEFGNNIELARVLKLKKVEPFAEYHGSTIGFKGVLPKPLTTAQIADRLQAALAGKVDALALGPVKVKSVGIVSGGGGGNLADAVKEKLDCYITGEPVHWNYHEAAEEGINVIYAGHYFSETVGVKALGKHIAAKFKVQVEFLDVPTPI